MHNLKEFCQTHPSQVVEFVWKDRNTPSFYGTACGKCSMDCMDCVWSVQHVRADVNKLAKGKTEEIELAGTLSRFAQSVQSQLLQLLEGMKSSPGQDKLKAELINELTNGPVDQLARRKVRLDNMLKVQCCNNRFRVQVGNAIQNILRILKGLKQDLAQAFRKPAFKSLQDQEANPEKVDFTSRFSIFEEYEQTPATWQRPPILDQIEVLKQKVEAFKQLSKEVEKLQMEADYYKKSCEKNYVHISQLEDEIKMLELNSETKQIRLEQFAKKLKQSEGKIQKQNANLAAFENKLIELESQKSKTEVKITCLNTQVQRLKQQLVLTEKSLKQTNSAFNLTKIQLNDKKKNLEVSEIAGKELETTLKILKKQSNETINQLTLKLKGQSNMIKQYEQHVSAHIKRTKELQSKLLQSEKDANMKSNLISKLQLTCKQFGEKQKQLLVSLKQSQNKQKQMSLDLDTNKKCLLEMKTQFKGKIQCQKSDSQKQASEIFQLKRENERLEQLLHKTVVQLGSKQSKLIENINTIDQQMIVIQKYKVQLSEKQKIITESNNANLQLKTQLEAKLAQNVQTIEELKVRIEQFAESQQVNRQITPKKGPSIEDMKQTVYKPYPEWNPRVQRSSTQANFYHSFVEPKESSGGITPRNPLFNQLNFKDSNILSDRGKNNLTSICQKVIHISSTQILHNSCKNIPQNILKSDESLLVLIQTKQSQLFGGFLQFGFKNCVQKPKSAFQKYMSEKTGLKDKNHSFLFSMSTGEIMMLLSGQQAAKSDKPDQIIFGKGDLVVEGPIGTWSSTRFCSYNSNKINFEKFFTPMKKINGKLVFQIQALEIFKVDFFP